MDRDSESKTEYDAARSEMDAGNLAAAIEHFRASVAIHPHFKALELLGECLLRSGSASEAVIYLAAATALNRQVRAPSLLAEALHTIGELDRAREVAEAVLERDPGNRRARVILEAS